MSIENSPLTLGSERISKLLTQYAIPAIIAMTASSLYNMADSIFIGQGVGSMAIAGLALTFPLMNLAAAFGSFPAAQKILLLYEEVFPCIRHIQAFGQYHGIKF